MNAGFAKHCYVVLSYSTRGFGLSDGVIDVAGPKDMEDLDAVLAWLQAEAPVDQGRIGIAGISYGAGIALLAASTKKLIRTAVAMSGWADLERALYGNETPRLVWGLILIGSGYFTGKMDPAIAEHFQHMLTNSKIGALRTWAAERSAVNVIDQLNAAGKPVYISNNLSDNLFQPNPMLDYFARLTVPKRLDLNNGIHATAEMGGILGAKNYVWSNAHDWLDHWLKGIDNGVMTRPALTIQKKFGADRVEYTGWPAPGVAERTYYLQPRTLTTSGKLLALTNTTSKTNTILSGSDTLATTGVPLLSDIAESSAEIPVYATPDMISTVNGIVYESEELTSPLKIRGKAVYTGWISLSTDAANLNVYLYEVHSGIGKLLTHGTATLHDAVPDGETKIVIDLNAIAYDVPAGKKLAIAIDTYDPQYAVPTLSIYRVDFVHTASKQSTLQVQSE